MVSLAETPLTGKPDAGNPPVRFGGRGGAHRAIPTPILLYNQPCSTFVGWADSPLGPWAPVTPGDGLVIPDHLVKNVITLDAQTFEQKDGSLFGYWGTWGIYPNSGCGFGVFNPDMKSFARLGMIPNTQAKDFFEGPFMLERNGVYYFTYSSGSCHDASYRVQYAVSDRPDGEFKMGPNNPILASTPDGKVHGPGHHSVLQRGEDYFIVYHRHDLPVTPNGMHRQTCADRLVFERDGVIKKVEPTHAGVGYLGPKARREDLLFGKKATASSFYRDTLRNHEYKPEYAVDDNNATLWRPADNRPGHWLTVDLGSPQRVRRTEARFEYGTWSYQYLIESSLDGETWKTFADRRQNRRWGSPMVDDGDVEARFLRITITGTEYPGLFGALWNFKAYEDASADSLLAMADKAFAEFVASKPPSSRNEAQSSAAENQGTLRSSATLPLIHLDVANLQLGSPVAVWTNQGSLGGNFRTGDAPPVVGMAAGRKGVRFSGKEILTASFAGPRALAGNSSFTVAAWVNNPEIGESECFLSWAGRGGRDAATSQFGYGTHPEFGAVGHWGFADMGFRGGPPKAGRWHHLAVVFDGVIERVYVDGQSNNSEAKMLMMHEGRPVYVGASEPGTEHFDGYLASLRVFGEALNETEVKKLATDEPSADVLVQLDSAKLDYGPLKSWANNGSLGGEFSGEKPPVVEDVQGRIAVRFEPGQSLQLAPGAELNLTDFALLASVANPSLEAGECVLEVESPDGSRCELLTVPAAGGWQEMALVYRGGRGTLFLDGKPATRLAPAAPPPAKVIRVGGKTPFSGALSRVQLFRRALSDAEVLQLSGMAKQERRTPSPSPAAFAQAPASFGTAMVAMTAQPARAAAGGLEYNFTETTGHAGASSNGWTPKPFFLDDGLAPNTRYAYTVKVRDGLGNVTGACAPSEVTTDAAQFEELTDKFDTARDFLAQGTDSTFWSGFLAKAEDSQPEVIAAKDGVLRLQSKGTVWDGGRPLGPFLFKLVPGDFVAEATVADYAGLSERKVPGNNDGGLMVRVPKPAGRNERLLQLNFFPIWNQGNMVTVLDGGRSQKGNGLAWNAHRHLQIIRQGGLFYFRTSADGEHWQDVPGSPVERKELGGIPLQVGLYHSSYGEDSSFITFSNFRLTTHKPTP
jgi:hypothetical protein